MWCVATLFMARCLLEPFWGSAAFAAELCPNRVYTAIEIVSKPKTLLEGGEEAVMYLCMCKSITDQQIRQAFEQGARTIGDLSVRFGVGIECGKCLEDIRQFLDACAVSPASSAVTPPLSAVAAHSAQSAEATLPAPPEKPAPERAAWFAVDL